MFGFSKNKNDKKAADAPPSEARQTFSDLMRGLQYSVNAAQQVLERHHLYLLGKYIRDGVPMTQRVRLNDRKVVDIPLLACMNQGALGIDEIELEFRAKIDASAVKKMREKGAGTQERDFSIDRSCFEMNFTPSGREGDAMRVRIRFKNRDVPEGVARLTDELNKEIYPKDVPAESAPNPPPSSETDAPPSE